MGDQSRKVTGGYWSAVDRSRRFDDAPITSGLTR